MSPIVRGILGLGITILFITTVGLGQGTAPTDAPKKTDSTFVTQVGDDVAGDLGNEVTAGKSIRFTIKIDRVVGETDGQGKLTDPVNLMFHGVIAPYVTVKLLAYDIDSGKEERPECAPREVDKILINSQEIGKTGGPVYLKGKDKAWRTNSFDVPISIIRFGIYQNGQWLGAGDNQFEIKISVLSNGYYCPGRDGAPGGDIDWSAKVKWAAISVKALYPVIMIHGTESSGAFFTNNNFTTPFNIAGIPYDNSIQLNTNLIGNHGNQLAIDIPRIAKDKFHVKHVHIIGHSQGGLDTRDFLGRTMPKGDLSILSLITLDTPHHGSPGADYAEDSKGASAYYSDQRVRVAAAQAKGITLATPNLRVSYLRDIFNPSNDPTLPDNLSADGVKSPVRYFAFGSDADANGNGEIETAEYGGMIPFDGWRLGGAEWSATKLYKLIGEVSSTTVGKKTIPIFITPFGLITKTVPVVREVRNTTFQPNDLVVTVESSQHQKFTYLGQKIANHSNIGRPNIANEVINTIRSINPVNQ